MSAYASELIYPPGKAKDEDRRAAQLETVIGVDNRTRLLDTQMAPWRMICAIRARWGSRLMVGTGCFIGPDTILTAGHVTYAREFQTLAQQIEVIPGLSVERAGGEKRPYGSAIAREVHRARELEERLLAPLRRRRSSSWTSRWASRSAGSASARGTREELLLNWAHVTGYPGEMKEERPPGAHGRSGARSRRPSSGITRRRSRRSRTAGCSTRPTRRRASPARRSIVLPEAGQYGAPQVVGVHAYGTRSTPGAIGLANSGVWIDADMLTKIQAWSAR